MVVSGIFCDTPAAQIAFMQARTLERTDEVAADRANKAAKKRVCAYWMPRNAIPGPTKTVVKYGLVFHIQAYTFEEDGVTRWASSLTPGADITTGDL